MRRDRCGRARATRETPSGSPPLALLPARNRLAVRRVRAELRALLSDEFLNGRVTGARTGSGWPLRGTGPWAFGPFDGRVPQRFCHPSESAFRSCGLSTWPEMKLHYCCTVISVPACVVRPLYIAIVGWSPLASEGGTTTLN